MVITLDPATRTWAGDDGRPVRATWYVHPGTLAVVLRVGDAYWHLSAIFRTQAGGVEAHLLDDPAPIAPESLIPLAECV
jgi:hypothetical protein